MVTKQTTCNYCSLACNFNVTTESGKIVKVVPSETYPVNKGFSCIKGLFLGNQTLKFRDEPLPRIKNSQGNFEYTQWDDAYKLVASRLLEIKEKHGGDAIAGISTGQMPTEEMALFGHMIRTFLKGNVDGNTRLCMATSVVAHKQSFGFDAPPYTLNDFELSDTIILIGANPIVAHPVIWDRIRSNKNKKVIVIDPRRSETAIQSDYHFQVKPKGDIYLFYTLANVLIEKNWVSQEYIDNHTEGFAEFKEFVKGFTLDKSLETSGLSKEQMLELATLIHEGKNVSLWWTMGINQGYEAVRSAQSIINIALMTGNMGRPGTGANSITGQANAMGSRLFSNTVGLFGGGDYDNEARRQVVGAAIGIDPAELPVKPTLPYNVIIDKINAGEIKALWVVTTNPRHSWANNEDFARAIKKLDLYIVQDLYGDTESSQTADVFFPVCSGLSKDGLYINTERRLSRLQPIVESDRPSDFQVFRGVGTALGMGDFLKGWETPKDAFNLLKKCTKNMPCDITGVDYDKLKDSIGVQWPCPEGSDFKETERRLFENGLYYTPSKKAKFVFEAPIPNPVPTSKEFPFVLNTGRGTVGQWHTQSRTREIPHSVDTAITEAYIYMNTKLAKEFKIEHLGKIKVSSINGESSVFMVQHTENLPYDQLYAPIHYIETNRLTPSVFDPYSKEPSYKTTPIQIQKI
ncbi:MAG: molybdopterin oxidoreductase family protein [Brevinema sp.]